MTNKKPGGHSFVTPGGNKGIGIKFDALKKERGIGIKFDALKKERGIWHKLTPELNSDKRGVAREGI